MSDELKHIGVKGMKWGVRKAKDWARAAGTMTKNSIVHPFLSEKANHQSIQSEKKTSTKLRRAMLFQTTKEIEEVNRMVEQMKNPKLVGEKVKTLFGTRTKAVYDKSGNDISSKPFVRLGKKKGQSDKDFDVELEREFKSAAKDEARQAKTQALIKENRNKKIKEFADAFSDEVWRSTTAFVGTTAAVVVGNIVFQKIKDANS